MERVTAGLHKTAQKSTFPWTEGRVLAAQLVAEDRLTDEEIAEQAGVARRTLATWKQRPEFAERVAQHVAELERAAWRLAIAKRRERIRVLNEMHEALLRVIQARAEAYAGLAPGASTGLLVKTIKVVGFGANQQVIEEWGLDTGLLREIRALEKQAAQELGQWSEKSTVNHTGGIRREFVIVPDTGAQPLTEDDLSMLTDDEHAWLGDVLQRIGNDQAEQDRPGKAA